MFGSNGRNPFTCRGVGCVKLPATAAFPTDDKLLQRIEEARRALPRDSISPCDGPLRSNKRHWCRIY